MIFITPFSTEGFPIFFVPVLHVLDSVDYSHAIDINLDQINCFEKLRPGYADYLLTKFILRRS